MTTFQNREIAIRLFRFSFYLIVFILVDKFTQRDMFSLTPLAILLEVMLNGWMNSRNIRIITKNQRELAIGIDKIIDR